MPANKRLVAAALKGIDFDAEDTEQAALASGQIREDEPDGDDVDLRFDDEEDDDLDPDDPDADPDDEGDTPPADAWTPPTQEEWEAAQAEQQTAQQITELFETNPAYLMQLLIPKVGAANAAAIMAQLGAAAPAAPVKPGAGYALDEGIVLDTDVDSLNPEGQFVVKHSDFIRRGMEHLQTLNQRQSDDRALMEYQIAVQQEQIAAMMELLELQLPESDLNEVAQYLPKAGNDIRKAVKETYGKKVAQAKALKKQQNVRRPNTPRGSSGGGNSVPKLAPNAGLREIVEFKKKYGERALLRAVSED